LTKQGAEKKRREASSRSRKKRGKTASTLKKPGKSPRTKGTEKVEIRTA